MYKKLAVFTFLSLMGVVFLELAVFAKVQKVLPAKCAWHP